MKLRTHVSLLLLSAIDNDISVDFVMSQVWVMKLTESRSIYFISDRIAHTIKVNIKGVLMVNDGSCNYLCDESTAVSR